MFTCRKCGASLDAAIAAVPQDGENHKCKCPKCGQEFEVMRPGSAPAPVAAAPAPIEAEDGE